jgi:hypothetical protein
MLQWFQKASSTIVSNVSIDAIKHIQDFEVSIFLVYFHCSVAACARATHVITFSIVLNS